MSITNKHQSRSEHSNNTDDLNNESDIIRKADLTLSDLQTNGGLLTPKQNNRFIRTLIDQPNLLNAVRRIPMSSPTEEVNKIKFGSRILKAASQSGTRALSQSDRAKPDTSKILLQTKEVIAEVRLPYEVIEDNIERGGLENTILDLIAERAALDLEELVINGDTGSSDAFLALTDGVLALATSNIVDAGNAVIDSTILSNAVKAVPTEFRRNKRAMRFFVSDDVEQDYRQKLSTRGTDLGDAVLTGNNAVSAYGVQMLATSNLPDSNIILCDPQNIVFGIQRNIRIESEREISDREFKIVLTARIAVELEEELAVTKVTNIAVA